MTGTYSEYLLLQKGAAPPADPHATGVRVYADANGALRFIQSDGTDAAIGSGGGSQTFAEVKLRTSLDFADPRSTTPVLEVGQAGAGSVTVTLPPSLFGNNGTVKVRVYNDGTGTFDVSGQCIVQSADGTVWIEQDGSDQTVSAGSFLDMDFPNSGGSAGAGLSWDSGTKAVVIASAGVYSAMAQIAANPTP